jgi:hypothetical protein
LALKASRALGGIPEDAAAADRKALSIPVTAPLKNLELRNSEFGLSMDRSGVPLVGWYQKEVAATDWRALGRREPRTENRELRTEN